MVLLNEIMIGIEFDRFVFVNILYNLFFTLTDVSVPSEDLKVTAKFLFLNL